MVKTLENTMHAAHEAFLEYRLKSGKQKANFLRNIADAIENLGDALLQTAHQETHLPIPRLTGERARTTAQLRSFADLLMEGSWVEATIDTAQPDRQPLPKPDLRKMSTPLGVVVVFGASNFPFAYSTAGVDTASALAAGCSVVVKAHPAHPETSALVAEAIKQAIEKSEMPKGVFGHILSDSFKMGQDLVMHSKTKAVGFTGSFTGGKALFDLANQRPEPIPVFAEMGSTNPVFLLPDALAKNAESIAKQYAVSITLGMGQFCTKPGLIFGIDGDDLQNFIQNLNQEITQITPANMLHGGIAENFRAKRDEVLSACCVQKESETSIEFNESQGIPSIASVSGAEFLKNKTLHQEVFGPFALIIKCQNLTELYNISQHLEGQLTTSIMGTEVDLMQHTKLIQAVSLLCGRLLLNGVPTGVEVCAAMQHGGPFPSSTDSRYGSVGAGAIKRFVRPISYQNFPEHLLPDELKTTNPLGIWRMVDNNWTK